MPGQMTVSEHYLGVPVASGHYLVCLGTACPMLDGDEACLPQVAPSLIVVIPLGQPI